MRELTRYRADNGSFAIPARMYVIRSIIMSTDRYVSPLSERYASKEMQYIFSPDMKFRTWRKLWIALAETEKELGLNITQEQIDELKAHADDINYDVAKGT